MFKHNQLRVVVSFPQISPKMELQSILTLSGLSPDDNGRELTCSAENIVGQTEASVLLNILCKNSHCVVWICFDRMSPKLRFVAVLCDRRPWVQMVGHDQWWTKYTSPVLVLKIPWWNITPYLHTYKCISTPFEFRLE